MIVTTLLLTARDPIVERDGRPFGAGQGNRMRGLNWPLPSVVAGSLRTALVKANPQLDFAGDMPQRLMEIEVAGVFPSVGQELYLPAPIDCLWDERTNKVHRVQPVTLKQDEGIDFPAGGLNPVRLTKEQAEDDFKTKIIPAWWPRSKFEKWLIPTHAGYQSEWFDSGFLATAKTEIRDQVCLDANTGAAAEGQIFATAGLNVSHLPRYGVPDSKTFAERLCEITLSVRVMTTDKAFEHLGKLNVWHPLGGERRLIHWQHSEASDLWKCPEPVRIALGEAKRIRMVLTTPAIFEHGWRPNWLDAHSLTGKPTDDAPTLKLVGVSNARWKAVSGWSLAKLKDQPRGPKPIRRMVPAGSVYFFEAADSASSLADRWLQSVCDREQDRRDGFGLAVWGTW